MRGNEESAPATQWEDGPGRKDAGGKAAKYESLELEDGEAILRSAYRKISLRLIPLLALAEGVAQLQKVRRFASGIRNRTVVRLAAALADARRPRRRTPPNTR